MFAWFERLLQPTTTPRHPEPPGGLIAFYWHFARQAKGLFAGLFAAGFAVALLDSLIPVFIGRIVSVITASRPENLFATFWPYLLAMVTVVMVLRPLALTAQITEASDESVTLTAEAEIDRADFGMTWNQLGMLKPPAHISVVARFVKQTAS